jgi:uncharacterized repeat protein (TIGR04061 family)
MTFSTLSIQKDCDFFPAFTRPALLRALPRDSRAFVRVDVSLRAYWHQIFDICPSLLQLSGADGMTIFLPFFEFVEAKKLTLDWNFHLWLYLWLKESQFRESVNEDILLELMGAAAARWAVLDRGRNCGVALGCQENDHVVIGWKCNCVDAGRQVELVEIANLPRPQQFFGCFFLGEFDLHHFPGWEELSR